MIRSLRRSANTIRAGLLRPLRSAWTARGVIVAMAAGLLLPTVLQADFWLSVLIYAGIAATGAVGLNILTGYAGQISIGHAFFLAVGAYSAARIGGDLDLPLPLWLLAAAVVGGCIGGLLGPFALRLRGFYLAIVTLGLVVVGEHIWRNFTWLTGGNSGTPVSASPTIGPIDFERLTLAGEAYSRNQGYFWLTWGLVAVCVLLSKNLERSRPGRALQAIRDHEQAAEAIGVRVGRYKVGAFAVSSGLAAMAGALYGSYQQYVSPDEWTLLLSVQYIAVIIVGGLGTAAGPVLGALFVGGAPALIDKYSDALPGIRTEVGGMGFISVDSLNAIIFGLVVVLFVLFEPRGMAAIWQRLKNFLIFTSPTGVTTKEFAS